MIQLIADSGSTTTDWALVTHDNIVQMIKTGGINPVHQTDETIRHTLTCELLPAITGSEIEHIHFYGAGCVGGSTNQRLARLIGELFPSAEIVIEGDLLGAARSLCGNNAGIAGILGTGANSCHYDGKKIVENIPPLGYILGDEGGGASLGIALLRKILRKEIDSLLTDKFYTEFKVNYSEIIECVYRRPAANRYLASFAPFIATHIEHPDIYALAYSTLEGYFRNHIMHYDYRHLPLHLTGSVAYYFAPIIRHIAEATGITIGNITRSPIEGLVVYHTRKL